MANGSGGGEGPPEKTEQKQVEQTEELARPLEQTVDSEAEQVQIKSIYPQPTYKSFEQKYFGPVIKETGEFLSHFITSFYGTVLGNFIIPTFARRVLNGQTWIQRDNDHLDENGSRVVGTISGVLVGGLADMIYDCYSLVQASQGDYTSIGLLAAGNAGSALHEIGRFDKSKKERAEYKHILALERAEVEAYSMNAEIDAKAKVEQDAKKE